ILQILDTPNLEDLVVNCGLAEWPGEVNMATPVLSNLRLLKWYTAPGATDEAANLRHLLQHCPNIEFLVYNYNSSAPDVKEEFLLRGDIDDLPIILSNPLGENHDNSPRLCTKLQRLHLACASFEQVRDLVLTRPAL
ncbi:hypothetical protein FRC01_014782, partial [Tulasnella sp. 417]